MKVGLIMMALALALAIVAVVVSIALRGFPQQAVASERDTATESPVQQLIPGESSNESWVEKARHLFTPEVARGESESEPPGSEPKSGFTLNPRTEPRSQSESFPKPQAQVGSGSEPESHVQAEPKVQPEPSAQGESKSQSQPEKRTLLGGESNWQRPTRQEVEAANGPRHYNLPAGAIMGLTIEAIGIYDAPVFDSFGPWALAKGVAHHPQTSLPWSPTPQRNVYLAGHRMGFRGTWSRMIFYNLDKLDAGDEVLLKNRAGTFYRYRVSEVFVVDPTDSWVMGQVRGRDMVTLQTCTPYPTFEKRLIVRAERA